MVNPKASISVLWLSSGIEKHLRDNGVTTVGQVMDIPAYLTYEEVYYLSKEEADILRDKIRLYLKNEGGIPSMSDKGVVPRQAVKIIEKCGEAPLEYPSSENTDRDKGYQDGYRAGWSAAIRVIRGSLDAVDKAVAEGMNK